MIRFATFLLSCLLVVGCGLPAANSVIQPTATVAEDLRATIEAELRATLAAEQPSQSPATPTTPPDPTRPAATSLPAATTAATSASPSETVPTAATDTEATPAPATSPTSGFEPGGQGPQTVVNLQFVFDASGSMAESLGSETRIVAARRASEQAFAELPAASANLNVGFRVFGHRGDNSEAGKAESCQSTELRVPMEGVNIELLRQQLNLWEPTGWTPISLALQQAGEAFPQDENVRNVIILVTDGEETCGGDPCAVAQALAATRAEVRIDLVGFGITPEVAQTLQCIPANSGGVYVDAQDGDALQRSLQELITASLQRSTLTIQTIDPDGPTADLIVEVFDEDGADISLVTELDEALSSAAPFADGRQRVELPQGSYRIEITAINNPVSQITEHSTITYDARVVEGQNTDAVVGFGSLNVTSDDTSLRLDGSDRFSDIELQKQIDDSWEATLTQRFYPGKPFRLTPGIYRLVYLADGQERPISDAIVIAPGKAVAVTIQSP